MSGGLWRKTLVYLGLVEEPEEHDDLPERFGEPARARQPVPEHAAEAPGTVRPLRMPEPGSAHVRAMATGDVAHVARVEVGSFEDCERIGTRYRGGQPVLFDMAEVDKVTARRVLDFVAGVTFALRGRLRRAGGRAFLLVPDGVELPLDELQRLRSMGYEVDA